MKNLKRICLAGCFLLAGCFGARETEETPTYYILPYEEEMIVLQNLKTRVLVYCYSSADITAAECAARFEKQGFVRLKDIPSLPAEYDFLKNDTYPTRRWRKDEKIPRW